MALSDLSSELLDLICRHIESKNDLVNFAQVSTSLRLPAERSLYQTITIKTIPSGKKLRAALQHDGRSKHVRKFMLDLWDAEVYESVELVDRKLGGAFNSEWMSLFPNLESLSMFSEWSPDITADLMESVRKGRILGKLKACTLAFKSGALSMDSEFWNIQPFEDLIAFPTLESLALVKATNFNYDEQKEHTLQNVKEKRPMHLKNLVLSSCHLTFSWLRAFFSLQTGLEELSIVVTRIDSAFIVDLFDPANECSQQLWTSLHILKYLSFLSVGTGATPIRLSHFEQLKQLSIHASDLFGLMNETNIQPIIINLPSSLPRSLEKLNLLVYSLDIRRDLEGEKEGIFKVLFEVLAENNRQFIPRLKTIVLRIVKGVPEIPARLVQRALNVGVACRAATLKDIAEFMDSSFMRSAMS